MSFFNEMLESIRVRFGKRTTARIIDRGPGPDARLMTKKFLILDPTKNVIIVLRPGEFRSWLAANVGPFKYNPVMARRTQFPDQDVFLYTNDGRCADAHFRYILLPKVYSVQSL